MFDNVLPRVPRRHETTGLLPSPPRSGRVRRFAASAQEEGGNGHGGPAEAGGEPGAEIAGGALGGQSGQPALGAVGAWTGQA